MRWNDGTLKDGWKPRFAIFPIKIGRLWVWLEWYDESQPFDIGGGYDIGWKVRYPSLKISHTNIK